jgi:hypothetical protein
VTGGKEEQGKKVLARPTGEIGTGMRSKQQYPVVK